MKKVSAMLIIILITGIFLTSCTGLSEVFNPNRTPIPPPYAENDTWAIQIMELKKYKEPKEFNCSECSQDPAKPGLSLQKRYSYVDVVANVMNKSNEAQNVSDHDIGLGLSSGVYACGGVTVAGTDFCLLAGVIRGEKSYINYGLETEEFLKGISFPPNSPDGEVVEFIFIVQTWEKYAVFYFDDLPALDISKLKH
jgi:hypothetical protein